MTFNAEKDSYDDVTPYICKICNVSESANYYANKKMVDKQLCFDCNFWNDKVYLLDKTIRINGEHYVAGTNPYNQFNGFGGRKFIIKKFDGTIIETCDLWYQGVIPQYFKDKIPDNAQFIETPKAINHGQGFYAKW